MLCLFVCAHSTRTKTTWALRIRGHSVRLRISECPRKKATIYVCRCILGAHASQVWALTLPWPLTIAECPCVWGAHVAHVPTNPWFRWILDVRPVLDPKPVATGSAVRGDSGVATAVDRARRLPTTILESICPSRTVNPNPHNEDLVAPILRASQVKVLPSSLAVISPHLVLQRVACAVSCYLPSLCALRPLLSDGLAACSTWLPLRYFV